MTTANLANHQTENRGKIGPWDVTELCELVAAFHEVGSNIEQLIALEGEAGSAPPLSSFAPERIDEFVGQIRRALFELTKGLAGTVVAGAPEVATELARSFFVIFGSTGTKDEEPRSRVAQWEPLRVTVLSTETRKHEVTGHTVDVALLRLAYYDAESSGELPSIVDGLLVRRDRNNDDRRVRHFPQEQGSQHFDRAVECRAQWLGVSEGPFTTERQRI